MPTSHSWYNRHASDLLIDDLMSVISCKMLVSFLSDVNSDITESTLD